MLRIRHRCRIFCVGGAILARTSGTIPVVPRYALLSCLRQSGMGLWLRLYGPTEVGPFHAASTWDGARKNTTNFRLGTLDSLDRYKPR